MPCTIAQLLANPRLDLTLLTPGADLTTRVTWAHTSELVDPTPWLEGGELLMTLGVLLPSDPSQRHAYVARLAAAGVAALAVDTGIIFESVPEELVRAGEEHGLPVLGIAARTPLIAIAKAVVSAITADSVAAVAEVSRRQDRIAAAAVTSGAAGVVRTLAPLLGCDVLVATPAGAVLEAAGSGSARLRARLAHRLERMGPGGIPRAFSHVDGEGVITVQSLSVEDAAGLVLAIGSRARFTTHERLVVAHAAHLLNLVLRTPDRIRIVESRLRRAAGRSLTTTNILPDPELLQALGFHPAGSLVVAVLHVPSTTLDATASCEHFLLTRGTAYLLATTGAGISLVLPASGAEDLVRQLTRALGTDLHGRLAAGISDPAAADQLVEAIGQAATAAQAAAREGAELLVYGELGPLDLFLRTQPAELLEALTTSVLRPLLDWDARQGSELVTTVTHFLEQNGQSAGAARELRIHRHTLRQRLDRIEMLLGRSLDDAGLRADLWVALRAHGHLATSAAHRAEAPK